LPNARRGEGSIINSTNTPYVNITNLKPIGKFFGDFFSISSNETNAADKCRPNQ
jgi:hypothetical protein